MKILYSVLFLLFFSFSVCAQADERDRAWNAPVEPFHVIGDVYYVGAAEITSFLITTPEGHILLDGGFAETAPQILANIKKLGYKPEDVKILLNSQAHYDHAAGLAALKRATGARLFATREDAVLLENGGKDDFAFGDKYPFEPVKVDRFVEDGEKIKLGHLTLEAVLTPGHTKGCTTWTLVTREVDRKISVVFVGSTTAPGYQLAANEKYPNIVADFERTFSILKKLKPDVFLASHGNFFNLTEKAAKRRAGISPNPFIDPQGYRDFLTKTEAQFREQLKTQQAAKK